MEDDQGDDRGEPELGQVERAFDAGLAPIGHERQAGPDEGGGALEHEFAAGGRHGAGV